MDYMRFLSFNVFGGIGWVFGMTMLGYMLGGITIVKQHLEKVIVLIILISVAPVILEAVKAYRKSKSPVAVEPPCGKAGDVLQQHSARAGLLDEPQCLRKQVPFVLAAELLSRNRERRAGYSSR